ncbi:MAG: NADH:flavin oxidoreductase [Verrucomicrobia bacterium]|nr:NADH:flavin oxidoreductase [Verrucomicrobiota bacterium]
MPPRPLVRIPSIKTVADFRQHTVTLGLELPCDDGILTAPDSPLAQPAPPVLINGKRLGNRWAVQPMEGWDGTTSGGVTDEVRRRWQRFGESGAKLVCGGEAIAVRPDGRANPNQLVLSAPNLPGFVELVRLVRRTHQERHGAVDDLVLGFQLTHSGRFCRPTDKRRMEPRVAYRHPLLDAKFGVTADTQVLADAELEPLVQAYATAADLAREAGADFVDLKHCHGYLLHEFLSAHTRPGPYGGAFENRTRLLREIVQAIRARGNPIDLAVRLSAFDFVPFRPDPASSQPGKPGPGIPDDFGACLPYRYGFGVNPENPLEPDLTEAHRFLGLCATLGVKLVNLTAGSPYYNPHIQRPAAYPPSDGYQPPEDPLVGVARQIHVVRQLKARAPAGLLVLGSAYSYLQEYLPQVAQAVVRQGWTDLVGIGRMILSYPGIVADTLRTGQLNPRLLCRTFSDCTTAPRGGLISGCYPLDDYYAARPEATELKRLKRGA